MLVDRHHRSKIHLVAIADGIDNLRQLLIQDESERNHIQDPFPSRHRSYALRPGPGCGLHGRRPLEALVLRGTRLPRGSGRRIAGQRAVLRNVRRLRRTSFHNPRKLDPWEVLGEWSKVHAGPVCGVGEGCHLNVFLPRRSACEGDVGA